MRSLGFRQIKGATVELILEPRDVWVGVFWRTWWEMGAHWISLYICLMPFFPVRISWRLRKWKYVPLGIEDDEDED